jgi:putative methionine-R-sulfoxide reductase with GAF domain
VLLLNVVGGGGVVGTLIIDSTIPDAFSDKDLHFLTSFASPIGEHIFIFFFF